MKTIIQYITKGDDEHMEALEVKQGQTITFYDDFVIFWEPATGKEIQRFALRDIIDIRVY